MKGLINNRKITIGFGIVVVLVALIGVAAFQNVHQFFDTYHWVDHTLEVLSQLEDTNSTLDDAETGQRGYVITGDEHYLEPYNTATANIDTVIQNIRELTADNPHQQARLDTLDPLIVEEFAIMRQIIDLRRNNGFEDAQQIISSGNGKAVMDNIRAIITAMKTEENRLLQVRRDEAETAGNRTLLTFTVLTVLAIGLLSGGYYLILRDISERKQSETALKRYAQRMEILHQIDLKIIEASSIQSLLEVMVKHLRQLIPCPRVSAALIDPKTGEAVIFALDLNSPSAIGEGVRSSLSLGWFDGFDADNTRIINDFRSLPDPLPAYQQLIKEGIVTSLQVLLMGRERPIGVFALSAATPGFFTAEHQEIAAEVARQLTIAIRQLNLFEELAHRATELEQHIVDLKQAEAAVKRYAERMEILHEIDVSLMQGGSIQALVNTAIKNLRQIVTCQRVDVTLIDETSGEAIIFAIGLDGDTALGQGVRIPIPPNIFEGYDAKYIRVFDDIRVFQDTRPRARQLVNEGLLCALSALLMDQERPIGVLGLFADKPGFFTAEHQEIVAEIANQLAIVIKQLRQDEELARHAKTVEDMSNFLQTTLDAFPANTIVLDPNGNIISVNHSWKRFADENNAHSTSHYLDSNYLTICNTSVGLMSDEAPLAAAGISTVIAGQKDEFILEYPCNSPSEERWFMLRATPFAESVPRRVVVAHINITERKRAEQALQVSYKTLEQRVEQRTAELQVAKERVEAILNNSTDGILLVHTDFTIRQTNKSFNGLFACEPDDYFGESLVTLVQVEDADKVTTIFQTVAAEQQGKSIEIRTLRKDGTVFDAELSLARIKDDGLVCTIRDITERKVQERQLRYYASLQENVTDAVISSDLEYHIQSWNKAAERMYGWSAEEVIGKFSGGILQTQFLSSASREQMLGKLSEQGYLTADAVQRHKDGSDVYVLASIVIFNDEHGHPLGIVTINHDITERKAQERQLRYQSVFQENVSDAVIVTDMEFRIQSWNRAAERIYGWSAEEAIGKAAAEVLHTEYPSTIDQAGAILQLREQGWWQDEVIQHHKDGHSVHILGSVTIIKDENGMAFSVVSVNHDISERIRVQQSLEASDQRFKLLVSSIQDYAIIMLDVDGNITSWNPGAELIKGYTAGEIIDRHISLFYTSEDIAKGEWQRALKIAEDEGHFVGEGWRVRKNGSLFWASLVITALRDSTGQLIGFTKVTRDLTERKRAEEALNAKIEEEREFQEYLKALHEITIELTQIDDLDMFYRRAVELGLERFGFERLGLLLYEADQQLALGTYGTDAQGKLKPEHHITFNPRSSTGILSRTLNQEERFIFDAHAELYSESELIGWGWNAASVLWNGSENLGWLAADNGVHHTPVSKPLLDVLSLYALTLSTLLVQKRGELARRESEARYRLLAENITDVVLLSNAAGEYIYVSPSITAMMDYEPEELMGQSALNYVHPDDQAAKVQASTTAIEQNTSNISLIMRFRHKLGHYVWLETIGRALRSEKTGEMDGFISSSRDITQRKAAEDALRESEVRYRLLADNITDVVVRANAMGEYVYVSPSSLATWGFEPEELIGQSISNFVHPDDLATIIQAFMGGMNQNHSTINMVVRFQHKQGNYIWMETEGQAIYSEKTEEIESFITSSRDISDRKRAEEALRESEEKYRSLIETMRGGLAMFDLDNRITYINDRFCEILGYSRAEVMGTRAADYIDATNLSILKTQLERRRQSETTTYELLFRHKDGSPIYLLVSGSPLLDKNESINGSFAVTTDITAQKQAEEKLRQAFEKEKELGELKSRFVSMASHEFRTPLATILALTDTLSAYRHKLQDHEIAQLLVKIQDQIGHLKDIMDDVLLLARMQARRMEFNPVKIDLDSFCRSVMDEFQSRPDITQQLVYSCDKRLHEVVLDKKLMRQIINNLVSNAIKYSPANSSITISLEFENDTLIFKVADQGIGIPEADLKHLFEPFHRAENVGAIAGTGLGLIITKESVDLHNGTITAESQVGVGTTFTVSIPLIK